MKIVSFQKFKKMVPYIFLIVSLVMCVYSLRYEIVSFLFKSIPLTDGTHTPLTAQEKIDDFNALYDVIVSSMPQIEAFEESYGIDFYGKKQYYTDRISKTENDFDYFLTLWAIFEDIPSFHTDIIQPATYSYLCGYNSEAVQAQDALYSVSDYWYDLEKENAAVPRDVIVFEYVDGQYVLLSDDNKVEYGEMPTLCSINGTDPLSYMNSSVSCFEYHYDGANHSPYKRKLVFDCNEGDPVSLSLIDADGRSYTRNVYSNLHSEFYYAWHREDSSKETIDIYETDGVAYLRIDEMTVDSCKEFQKSLDCIGDKALILDLRENTGGNLDAPSMYIYPSLYKKSFDSNRTWYIAESISNNKIIKNWAHRLFLHIKAAEGYSASDFRHIYQAKTRISYIGESDLDHRVIILTDCGTGSSADRFVADMKDSELAVVIGNNTGGEGLMGSYMCGTLPNSHLAYIYMPGMAHNKDKTDNSVFGTAPDIYVNKSLQDYYAELYGTEVENKYNLPDELKYDSVVKYAFEYLSGDR